MNLPFSILFSLMCTTSVGPFQNQAVRIFNQKNLDNWDIYLGPGLDAHGKHRPDLPAPGLNKDPYGVFTVVRADGKPAIRISGERFGGLSTKEEFEDYHLRFRFKWGRLKWAPKDKAKMDSGVLYHAVGLHGVDWGFWMRSQEFQIQEGDCGDYWGLDGASFDIPAVKTDKGEYRYDPTGTVFTFNVDQAPGRHCIKSSDGENPTGEWNTVDLYCHRDTAVHMVNGKVNMILYRSRHIQDGVETPLTKGKIQLQSEGAEIFYTDMTLTPIRGLPAVLLKGNQ